MRTLLVLSVTLFSLVGFTALVGPAPGGGAYGVVEVECPRSWELIDEGSEHWYANADMNGNGSICLHPSNTGVTDDQ